MLKHEREGKDTIMCLPLPFGIFRFKRQNTKKEIKFCRERKNRLTKERRTSQQSGLLKMIIEGIEGNCVVPLSEELEELDQLPTVCMILEAMQRMWRPSKFCLQG